MSNSDELDTFENIKVKIAVIGRSGVGKSSFINALYGKKVAETGATETTQEIQEFEINGLILADLPGCGTKQFPSSTYLTDMNLEQYDAFVLIIAKRVYEDDLYLIKSIADTIHKKVHLVRSMMDQDVHNAARDGRTEHDVLSSVRSELLAHFGEENPCWLISSIAPEKFDFSDFEGHLLQNLPPEKHDKFIFAAQAYSLHQIERKRKVAENKVHLFATLAAANGFNPIFGADIIADIAILLKMNKWILRCYKMDEESIQPGKGTPIAASTLEVITKKMLAFGTREFVLGVLKKRATRITAMEISKLVPVVGQLASAGLGFALTRWMGLETIKKCEEALLEITKAHEKRTI